MSRSLATKTTTQEDADHIAQVALQHYDTLPQKSKPSETEWTVYAAIVAVDNTITCNSRVWVVSSATGTKCCVIPPKYRDSAAGLCVLTDCHAEILARRGLHRVLYSEIKCLLEDAEQAHNHESSKYKKKLLRVVKSDPQRKCPTTESSKFQLRDNLTLHLYLSDSPCGDASIYSMIRVPHDGSTEKQIRFTGAKAILSDQTASTMPLIQNVAPGVHLVRERQSQLLGNLRTKSGRSNLEPHLRSRSMSCSDKITRWTILGLQGWLLEKHLVDPLRLTSIVVSKDHRADSASQLKALQRAVIERAQATFRHLQDNMENGCLGTVVVDNFWKNAEMPSIYLVDASFGRGKASSVITTPKFSSPIVTKKRKLDAMSTIPACGLCSNWQCSDEAIELVVGARGLRHGRKPNGESDFVNLCSRLSRRAMVYQVLQESVKSMAVYQELKQRHTTSAYCSVRNFILSSGPLAGWLVGDNASSSQPRNVSTDREESHTLPS